MLFISVMGFVSILWINKNYLPCIWLYSFYRHSPLDLEFPRYPPPRRIIPAGRGYPPFDRRHPIPPPHALYNPMHRYPRDTVTVSGTD